MGFWDGRRALVTGAGGFIGANLTQELLRQGAQVVALERDALPTDSLKLLGLHDRVVLVRGDVCDYLLVRRVLNELSVSHCFHLAAQTLVGVASSDPLSTFESNIRGTYMVLEACRAARGIEGVVVASSDKAYGVQEKLPYTEDTPLMGQYPYDASKACADILARSYHVTYQLPTVVTRNANVYGPADMNFANIVPYAVRCALTGKPIALRSDGKMQRDYLFVEDEVRAILQLAEAAGRDGVAGQAFNLGTRQPLSVLELCAKVLELAGSAVPVQTTQTGRHEIPNQSVDTSKVRRVLGWRAEHTLEQGLSKTIAWYRRLLAADELALAR
jgi:CDP-glucose 4,6-dehydratase